MITRHTELLGHLELSANKSAAKSLLTYRCLFLPSRAIMFCCRIRLIFLERWRRLRRSDIFLSWAEARAGG
jgi:hypothetical protein